MKKIDINQWDRKETYLFYKDVDVPRYIMSFDLDVTSFYQHVKQNKFSFYLALIYEVMQCLNQVENFRYRFINQEPYLLEKTHPSFTDLIEKTENFKIVSVDLEDKIELFIQKAKETSIKQGNQFIDLEKEARHDLVYITTFPWAKYTQVSHAHNLDRYDAVPRLVWGKFEEVNGKLLMPFSIEVHHAFVDGLHIGKLIQNLQSQINK
ncbi:MAG: CatA-like O-acetyltransferase [Acholeplasmataceae bacterium]|nr:CatA-like O-acetyltransferase [Acholeplasmataceae bacterium]